MTDISRNRVGSFATVTAAVLLIAALLAPAPSQAKKKEIIESYTANVMVMDSPGQANSSILTMNIYGWTSDEDRETVKRSTTSIWPTSGVAPSVARTTSSLSTPWPAWSHGQCVRSLKDRIRAPQRRWPPSTDWCLGYRPRRSRPSPSQSSIYIYIYIYQVGTETSRPDGLSGGACLPPRRRPAAFRRPAL